ncbi:hypothetical protein D9M68_815500 [compost metagenome]
MEAAAHRFDAMHVLVAEADALAGGLLRGCAAGHDFGRVGGRAVDRRIEDDRRADFRAVDRLQVDDVADVDRHVVQLGVGRTSDQVRGGEMDIHGVCSLGF